MVAASPNIMIMYFIGLRSTTAIDLLHRPAVPIRIVEKDEAGVVERVALAGWARTADVEHLNFAGFHPALDELSVRGIDVRDH
jgi:hypothetical protein